MNMGTRGAVVLVATTAPVRFSMDITDEAVGVSRVPTPCCLTQLFDVEDAGGVVPEHLLLLLIGQVGVCDELVQLVGEG